MPKEFTRGFLSDLKPLARTLDDSAVAGTAEEEAFERQTRGSPSEYKVYKWLTQKGLAPGIDFAFQSDKLGGISHVGNAKIHFLIYMSKLALRVQGYLWPNLSSSAHALDMIQRVIWEGKGYTVLDLLASEVDENVNRVMNLAMAGRMTAAAESVLR